MKDSCLRSYFKKIEELFSELNKIAPEDNNQFREIRNDLAGLLVVSLAATYENCVKTILINYADLFHDKFSHQVERKYNYLNSRIKYDSLKEYLNHFDGDSSFFEEKILYISSKLKNEINKTYDQILVWRHTFAHANTVVTSINDAYKAHRYAKYVLYAFEDSLIGHVNREAIKSTRFYANNAEHSSKAAMMTDQIICELAVTHERIQFLVELVNAASSNAKAHAESARNALEKAVQGPISVSLEQVAIAKLSAAESLASCKRCSQFKKQAFNIITPRDTVSATI